VRKKSGHDRGANKVIQTFQSFLQQPSVHVVKQIVDVLHRDFEILETQLKREHRTLIKALALRPIPFRRHALTTQQGNYLSKTKAHPLDCRSCKTSISRWRNGVAFC